MKTFKKFILMPSNTAEKFNILGLKSIYWTNNGNEENRFSGATCLVKNPDYPGYCTLCCVHHEPNFSYEFENGYKIEFAPLYTKDGDMILVKYEHDSMFCTVNGHPFMNSDCTLTLCKNGTIDYFNKNNDDN